uniref:Uncharacterized protein n=1 Tax=Peronospora matthiolae TaxID=2874970 RepID=A0AAV1TML1_9STRA
MRLQSAVADETKDVNAAGENLPAASSDSDSRVDALRVLGDDDLALIHSSESNGYTDFTKAATTTEPKAATKESSNSVLRSAMSLL